MLAKCPLDYISYVKLDLYYVYIKFIQYKWILKKHNLFLWDLFIYSYYLYYSSYDDRIGKLLKTNESDDDNKDNELENIRSLYKVNRRIYNLIIKQDLFY